MADSPALQDAAVPSEAQEADMEEFSGLRIENRQVPASIIRQEFSGRKQIVPFRRLDDFAKRATADRVVIGVLYHVSLEHLLNGNPYSVWYMTDLNHPRPKHMKLQVRGTAHKTFSKDRALAPNGSIFAVLNPLIVEKSRNATQTEHGREAILSVEKPGALCRLGDCPCFASCKIKNCILPASRDHGLICTTHRAIVNSQQSHRIQVFGGSKRPLSSLRSKAEQDLFCNAERQLRPKAPKTKVDGADGTETDLPTRSANFEHRLALALHNAAMKDTDHKGEYARLSTSGATGTLDASLTKSFVPKLGRGLDETMELDGDMDIHDLREQERIARERMEAPRSKARTLGKAKAQPAAPSGKARLVLEQPMRMRRRPEAESRPVATALRTEKAEKGVTEQDPGQEEVAMDASKTEATTAAVPAAASTAASDVVVLSKLTSSLSDTATQLSEALGLVRQLSATCRSEALSTSGSKSVSKQIYDMVGSLTKDNRELISREALELRRWWRANSDALD